MKTRLFALCAALLPLMACGDSAGAQAEVTTAPTAAIKPDDPRVALAAKIPGTHPEDLRATPVQGIYELTHGSDISYVTADAKYVFSGDLFRITAQGDFPNLTETHREEIRLAKLAAIPESDMLVFGPANAPHTITVFTDVDCPWCRKLHSQVADYNKLGIRVRYLFYPRTGPDTPSWYKAEAVWCAPDRNKALTLAKNDQAIDMKRCPRCAGGARLQAGTRDGHYRYARHRAGKRRTGAGLSRARRHAQAHQQQPRCGDCQEVM